MTAIPVSIAAVATVWTVSAIVVTLLITFL